MLRARCRQFPLDVCWKQRPHDALGRLHHQQCHNFINRTERVITMNAIQVFHMHFPLKASVWECMAFMHNFNFPKCSLFLCSRQPDHSEFS